MFDELGWLIGVACVGMMALVCVPVMVHMVRKRPNQTRNSSAVDEVRA